jgi:hypothetical protein
MNMAMRIVHSSAPLVPLPLDAVVEGAVVAVVVAALELEVPTVGLSG